MKTSKRRLSNQNLEEEYILPGSYQFFVKRMIEFRQKKGFTQAELAKKAGTQQPAISRFESGSMNSTLDFLYKLADALDVKLKITVS